MLPDWLPSLHLLLAPVPLVLFVTAFLTDLASLLLRSWTWGVHAATGLYTLSAGTALLVYAVSTDAAPASDAAAAVLARHADWSAYALVTLFVYALLRLGVAFLPRLPDRPGLHAVLVALAIGAGYLVGVVGTTGATLAFRYGEGMPTAGGPPASVKVDTTDALPDSLRGLRLRDDGWTWHPHTPGRWKDDMTWLVGSPPDVRAFLFEPEGSGQKGLALRVDNASVLFVAPPELGDVDVSLEVNTDDFNGTVRIVHHVRGARYYDAVAWDADRIRLIRGEGTQVDVFDQRDVPVRGWQTIRVVGAGTTFRAYVEDRMVLDADENPAGAGQVGLALEGNGVVRLRQMEARTPDAL